MNKKHNTKYKIHSTSKSKGLTMIELLIVIAILAVLVVILLWSLRGQTYKARDARRKADVDKYVKVFEEYFNDYGGYPVEGSIDNCDSADLMPYVNRVMCDPSSSVGPYYYWTNEAVTTPPTAFAICADLESDTDPDIAASGCAAGCGPGDAYDYCVVVGETISVVGGDYDAVGGGGGGVGGPGEYEYACVSGGSCDNVGVGSSCEYTFLIGGCYGLCTLPVGEPTPPEGTGVVNPMYLCD